MDLGPRQVAFVMDEMERVENSEARTPSEQKEAERIRKQAVVTLTE